MTLISQKALVDGSGSRGVTVARPGHRTARCHALHSDSRAASESGSGVGTRGAIKQEVPRSLSCCGEVLSECGAV